nr:hypothetical protein StreXyl84_45140 [Streptomyces sp. Xyl84]
MTVRLLRSNGSVWSPAAAYKTEVTGYDTAGKPTGTKVTVPSVTGEEKLAGTYTVATTATSVNGLPATTAYSTTNTNATTALPAETVTDHYVQDQLSIVDSTLNQAYLRGATYTPFGQLAQAQLGNLGTLVTPTLSYDLVTQRLATSITDRQAAGPKTLSNIKYSYDTVGNLTRVRDDQSDGTVVDDQCFAYDWARRLSEAWTTGDGCATKPVNGTGTPKLGTTDPYWTSWTFTDSGDRATETQHKAGPVTADTTRAYSYPTTVRAAQPHAVRTVTATGGATGADAYQYDATGNLTKKTPAGGPAQDLTWNEEGRLATSTVSGATTRFLYDADGTRLLKREPTATTLYLPGGQELVLTKSTNALAGTRYYTVPGGSAVRTSSDGRVRLLVADPHGTNTLSISATTLATNRRKTLPYGAPRGTAPTFWPGQKGFINGDTDSTTGLTHIGARDYDPATGRFISVDPLLELDKPQTIGGYAYSAHNPTTYSDPTGEGLDNGWGHNGTPDWIIKDDGTTQAAPWADPGNDGNSGNSGTNGGTAGTGSSGSSGTGVKKDSGSSKGCGSWGFLSRICSGVGEAFYGAVSNVPHMAEYAGWIFDSDCRGDGGPGAPGCDYGAQFDNWIAGYGYDTTSDAYQVPTALAAIFGTREGGLQKPSARQAPRFIVGEAGDVLELPSVQVKISRQKQDRHILNGNGYRGGGYFNSHDDAQAVLDAYHGGQAQIMGVTKTGNVQIRVPAVTGFDNNPRAGRLGVPTHIFMIKGTKSPSVVPMNPNAGAP